MKINTGSGHLLLDYLEHKASQAPAQPEEPRDRYFVSIGDEQAPILQKFNPMAAALDANGDGVVSSEEILDPETDLAPIQVDHEDFTFGIKLHLAGLASPYAEAYPSYAEVASNLEKLEQRYPDLVERVSLGKTQEGRDVWAVRVGRGEAGSKPGVLVTGGHHAREWAPVGSVSQAIEGLLEGYESDPAMARRMNKLELWFVPLTNPDGYEYARNADPDWRKNRVVIDGQVVGVDLNRNYRADYRFIGDAPDSISDDLGASDNPAHLTFRGPHAVSEQESQAITNFIDTRDNLAGVLDVHAFGRLILFPRASEEKTALYRQVAARIQESLDVPYTPLSIPELYPTTGDINAYGESKGLISMGLEIGTAFQPSPDKAQATRDRGTRAVFAFLDEMVRLTQPPPPQE